MKPRTLPCRRRPKIELISSSGIAREIGRSPRGVIDALARLEIEPEMTVPGGTYYRREVIKAVRESMRAANKSAVKPNSPGI
jgi:hypothetical protein